MGDEIVGIADERELAFRTKLLFAIDNAIDMRMAAKQGGEFFVYEDAHDICSRVRVFFTKALGFVPPEIEGSCSMCEAIISPEMAQKIELLKKSLAVLGPVTGVGMIIGGIGVILGWGAGTIAIITAWFTGTAIAGPLGLIMGGIGIATIAVYFALSDDKATYHVKFRDAMRKSIGDSIHMIWGRYGEKLYASQSSIEG